MLTWEPAAPSGLWSEITAWWAGGEADTVKYLDPIFATLASGCIMFNTFLSNLCQKTQGLRELDWGGERWHFDLALRFSS